MYLAIFATFKVSNDVRRHAESFAFGRPSPKIIGLNVLYG